MQFDLSPISKASEFLAAYRTSSNTITHLAGQDDLEPRAQQTAVLWAVASRLCPAASMMIARTAEDVSIASRHGSIIIEARSNLNLGLVRAVLKKFEPELVEHGPTDPVLSDKLAQRIWSLAQRIDQVEAPRVFKLQIGDDETFINAQKGAVEIVSQGAPEICVAEQIRTAAAASKTVAMTLDDDAGQGDGSSHLVSEFLGSASDDANILWSMDPDGLPRHSPKDANLDDVAAASTVADAFRRWHANTNGHIDLLDASGLVILKMTIASDNQSVTMSTTDKFRNGF